MILKFEVFMEKLQCSRMIHMYLPDDYLTSGRDYPVLYMFDGHNLFFDEDATFGRSWRLQEEIQAAGADLIVVGQECSHEGNARLDEYGPFPFYDAQFGYFSGKGKATMDFFINDLKPYIDAHFPTRPGRRWTWIGGSSCGGLMALYAACRHSDVYSRSLVISPYVLPVLGTLMADVSSCRLHLPARMYISWGAHEGTGMHAFIEETAACTDLANLLMDKGMSVRFNVKPQGEHTEASWQGEAADFLRFLMER